MGVRRQIYVEEGDNRLLEEQSRRTGLSASELIRRAIHECYGSGRRLSWEEVFGGGLEPRPDSQVEWVPDELFDDDVLHEPGLTVHG